MKQSLPLPGRSRWQPLRAGLADLFYYDAEEFWFHDGRLLLRGNNGTGKSKVLALMLPFLLDGELAPHRVEPDADTKKRMEWNLLLGGAHPHTERLGYTWLEFGRLDDDGTARYLTLGCGMKAVAGRGIVRHWFFVTPQRPGAGLALIDATGTALSRDRLISAVEGAGLVYETARSYRRAVDEALFGLGDHRYGALVDLLVQLRQPQLSKRPSERALSDALTEALPPMDQAVLADVAEAFRALEEDREALRDMAEAQRSAGDFLGHYRRYAQVAARRRAERPRLAQSAYEQAGAAVRAAHEEGEQAAEAARRAQDDLDRLTLDHDRLRAQDGMLRDAPEMRDARELERLAALVRQRAGEREQRDQDAERAGIRQEKAARGLAEAAAAFASAQQALQDQRRAAVDQATAARAGADHRQQVEQPLAAEDHHAAGSAIADLAVIRADAERIVQRGTAGVTHVETAHQFRAEARRAAQAARHAVEELREEAAALADQRVSAEGDRATAAAELNLGTVSYLAGLTELQIPDPRAVEADRAAWAETLDGPDPLQSSVERADLLAAQALTELRVSAVAGRDVLRAGLEALAGERNRLLSGEDDVPPIPHTRAVDGRAGRTGAPLWRLVDFAAGVPVDQRAGLEAALEAAGVLDAWVTPAGEVLASDTDDVLLQAVSPTRSGVTLAAVLTPAVDRAPGAAISAASVPDDVVQRILASIGLGRPSGDAGGDTWVSADGSFGIGVLTGRWHKADAAFIGAGAREAARRRRLAEIAAQIGDLERELSTAESELMAIRNRDAARERERALLPGAAAVQDAHRALALLSREYQRLQQRQDVAAGELGQKQDAATAAHEAVIVAASDVGMPSDEAELVTVKRALGEYRLELRALWPTVDRWRTARVHRIGRESEAADAEAALGLAIRAARQAESAWTIDAERERTLRESVGQAVEALQRQLELVAIELESNHRAREHAAEARQQAAIARAQAQTRTEERQDRLQSCTQERLSATEAFQQFAGTGLIAVALPDLELPGAQDRWAPDPTVRLARAIERDLAAVPSEDPAWASAQRRVNEEFKTLTDVLAAQGSTASAQLLDDGFVVAVVFRGRSASVPELVDSLAAEVRERGRILDEREREVLENHLVNEVASTLQELMSQAERQVGRMNAELQERPTSTGMKLRLRWIPREDGPAGLAQARQRLLRQSADAWSEQDRSAVGGFLQARIADVRMATPTGTWLEHLTAALDYRAWNRFVIERFQEDHWRSATGPASGGERVLAASVPLFAAASSHYASAGNPYAPRLVMLDEAFAGVDDNARAKYLGLLAAFDLDVVMTSEREWGCYPEVPGLAIAQLSRVDGINAVLVTNWRWDGVNRERRPRPDALEPVVQLSQESGTLLQSGLFEAE